MDHEDKNSGEVGKGRRATPSAEMETHSTLNATPSYPEHEKLRAFQHESHVLSGFLDMLDEQGLTISKWHEHNDDECYDGDDRVCGLRNELYDFGVPTKEQLIGLYLEIDPKKLSAEKDAMYQEIVAANTQRANTRGSA